MTLVSWPPASAAADALLARYLDRVLPGWRASAVEVVTGEAVIEFLWPVMALNKTRPAPTPAGEIGADLALERVADGAAFEPERLAPPALEVFRARTLVALSGAMAARMGANRVMMLPQGLSPEQRRDAAILRMLYQAPLSTEGLR